MIDRHHDLPLSRQAKVLGISRGSIYYLHRAVSAADLALMRRIDALHLEYPLAGSRMLQGLLSLHFAALSIVPVETEVGIYGPPQCSPLLPSARFALRTQAPPPFSGMYSTPASSADRIASTVRP